MKSAIKESLSKTMHDFKSYEPVEYGNIDSFFTSFDTDSAYVAYSEASANLKDSLKRAEARLSELMSNIKLDKIRYDWYTSSNFYREDKKRMDSMLATFNGMTDRFRDLTTKKIAIIQSYKPVFVGYQVLHSFRGKNMNGATVLNTRGFVLDKDLNKVVSDFDPKDKNDEDKTSLNE